MTSKVQMTRQTRQPYDESFMAALRGRVKSVNDVSSVGALTPLIIDGEVAGELQPDALEAMRSYPDVVTVQDSAVTLAERLSKATVGERSDAFATVTRDLRDRGVLKSWRDELLDVRTSLNDPPALLVERACLPLLGAKGYGAAVIGYSRCPVSSEQMVWVAQRDLSKPTWPGMLDVMAAGAISSGMSPEETARDEAADEAGVPAALAAKAWPVGAVSYRGVDEWGQLKRDVFFAFDLELPWDFEPSPHDGEVAGFERMTMAELARAVAHGHPRLDVAFKPNINLLMIDFLIRHGHFTPDDPGYLELLASLRLGDCR